MITLALACGAAFLFAATLASAFWDYLKSEKFGEAGDGALLVGLEDGDKLFLGQSHSVSELANLSPKDLQELSVPAGFNGILKRGPEGLTFAFGLFCFKCGGEGSSAIYNPKALPTKRWTMYCGECASATGAATVSLKDWADELATRHPEIKWLVV